MKAVFLKGRILLSDDGDNGADDSVGLLRLSHRQILAESLLAEAEKIGGPDGEDLLLLLADEAIQHHRNQPGASSPRHSPAARILMERYVRAHDWKTAGGRVCLGTAVRALVQLTVDVNNLPGVVEGDRAARCFAYLDGLLQAVEVGSSAAAED